MAVDRRAKLKKLAEVWKLSVSELIERFPVDGQVPGICMNPGCCYANAYSPAEEKGWCENCRTNTVTSAFVLGGVFVQARDSSPEARKKKREALEELADHWGAPVDELLQQYHLDSVSPAICMNPHCLYSTEYEPDQDRGWCPECEANSVVSALVLAGIL